MGLNTNHGVGWNRTGYVVKEATKGTYVKPLAGHGCKFLDFKIAYDQERRDREDARTTRDVLERISGLKKVSWQLESYLNPVGTATTAWDIGDLFECAMGGTPTVSGSVQYGQSDSQAMPTASISHQVSQVFAEAVAGAWVDECTLSIKGGEDPTVKFSGGAMSYVWTSYTTVNGEQVAGTSLIVTDADAISVGSCIQVGANTNAGAGFWVTAKSGTTLTLDVSLDSAANDDVLPFFVTPTTGGSPIAGALAGTLKFGATSLPISEFTVTHKNAAKPYEDQAFVTNVEDVTYVWREVMGEIKCLARRDLLIYRANAINSISSTKDLEVVFGTTAGYKLKVDCNQIELGRADMDVPRGEVSVLTIPFKALGSAGADSMTITTL